MLITAYSKKIIYWFLTAWFVLNLFQAIFLPLHEDEAYYWMYSRYLQPGYFDHPPMIALFIKTGFYFFQNTLGVRLVTVISGTFSAWLAWKTVKEYSDNAVLFIILYSSFVMFNLYGFMTTPDAPLLLFTVLFFYAYKNFIREDNIKWTLLLILACSGMLYSKYHGILVIFFTLLSNPALFKKRKFWLIVVAVVLLMIPHILWQAEHHYPSLEYHLSDRSAARYRLPFTTEYVLGQVLMITPILFWYFFYTGYRAKQTDSFIHTLKFNFYGVFLFFLASTFKGRVQPHWTLVGSIALFMLCYIHLSRNGIPKFMKALIYLNLFLIVLTRIIFISPGPLHVLTTKTSIFNDDREWAKKIKNIAGNHYIIFNKGFQQPAKYNFYDNSFKALSYNSRFYRKNQFDIWSIEDSLRGKEVYYITYYPHHDTGYKLLFIDFGRILPQDSFNFHKLTFYGRWIRPRLYQKVEIFPDKNSYSAVAGKTLKLKITLHNPYSDSIRLNNDHPDYKCYLEYVFMKYDDEVLSGKIKHHFTTVIPGGSAEEEETISVPAIPGDYKLFFSIRADPFPGTRNSSMVKVEVNDPGN